MNNLVSARAVNSFSFQRVPLETIRTELMVPFGLFVEEAGSLKQLDLPGGVFPHWLQTALKKEGTADLYIRMEEMEHYLRYIDFYQRHFFHFSENCDPDEGAALFYHSASCAIACLFEGGRDSGCISQVKMIAETTLSEVIGNEQKIKSLIRVCSHDYYTYTHSLDVAIYAIGIGMSLALEKEQIKRLGYAALMHDLGKSRLSLKILNKNGSLNESEFEQMKCHPEYGYEMLVQNGESDRDILAGVKHHHERFEGDGYPDNLKGEAIPFFARIVAVADVFNALTTRRSYKPALSTYDAFCVMKRDMGRHLDPEILDSFIAFMGRS